MERRTIFIIAGGILLAILIAVGAIFFLGSNKDDKPGNSTLENNGPSQGLTDPNQSQGQGVDTQPTDNNPPTNDNNSSSVLVTPEGLGEDEIVLDIDPSELDPGPEAPPVSTLYNPEADLDRDNFVDKSEWEQWIANHPEDLNQDTIITDDELAAYNNKDQEAIESMQPVTIEELQRQGEDPYQSTYVPPEESVLGDVIGDLISDLDNDPTAIRGGDPVNRPGAYKDEYGWCIPDSAVK